MPVRIFRQLTMAILSVALLVAACSGDDDSASTPTTSALPSAVPTSTPPPTATPLTDGEAVPTPEPTPDPVLVEAVDAADQYQQVILRILDDPRDVDVTDAIALELAGSPVEDYALEVVASMLADNIYVALEETIYELAGAEYRSESDDDIAVFFCVRSAGIWRDLDTDAVVRETTDSSFLLTYDIRRDVDGRLKVWSFAEVDADGKLIPCELTNAEAS